MFTDLIMLWLLILVTIDVILSGWNFYKDIRNPKLTATMFITLMFDLKHDLSDKLEGLSKEAKEKILDSVFDKYLKTRDLINKKNKESEK